jgi:hypothetical protein
MRGGCRRGDSDDGGRRSSPRPIFRSTSRLATFTLSDPDGAATPWSDGGPTGDPVSRSVRGRRDPSVSVSRPASSGAGTVRRDPSRRHGRDRGSRVPGNAGRPAVRGSLPAGEPTLAGQAHVGALPHGNNGTARACHRLGRQRHQPRRGPHGHRSRRAHRLRGAVLGPQLHRQLPGAGHRRRRGQRGKDQIKQFSPSLYHYISHLHIAVSGFSAATRFGCLCLPLKGVGAGQVWAWVTAVAPRRRRWWCPPGSSGWCPTPRTGDEPSPWSWLFASRQRGTKARGLHARGEQQL